MDLRRLRYFQAVAEELSFSRAARHLRIAQPALSRAVKEVEADLGAAVFERSRHYVRLTPAGSVLLREAAVLFDRFEEARQRVRRTAAGEEGELRLGYIGPPTQRFLGPLLGAYRERFPLVSLHLEERTPERVWEMVSKGRLSAALTRPVAGHEALGLRTMHLRDETLGVALHPRHPFAGRRTVGWRELEDEPLVVLARREGMGLHDAVLAACRQAGFAPRLAHTPSLIGTVFMYVEAGAGIGVVADSVGMTRESPVAFVPLRPRRTVPLVFVWRADEDTPAVRRFREMVAGWKAHEGSGAGRSGDGCKRGAKGSHRHCHEGRLTA